MNITKSCLSLLLATLLASQSAFAVTATNCGEELTTAMAKLQAGAKAFGKAARTYQLDEQTQFDLPIEEASHILDGKLKTNMGRAMWLHMLKNQVLDAEVIVRRQKMVEYVAPHPEEFKDLREQLDKISDENEHFLRYFAALKPEQVPLSTDITWAAITWTLLAAPFSLDTIGVIHAHAHWLPQVIAMFLGGGSFGWWNARVTVDPRRARMDRYRDQLVAAKLAYEATKNTPADLFGELHDSLRVIYEGPPPHPLVAAWLRLNAFFNPSDADLIRELVDKHTPPPASASAKDPINTPSSLDDIPVGLPEPTENDFATLNRQIRLMRRLWKVRVPFTDVGVPIYNFQTLTDKLHWANFWIRYVQDNLSKPENKDPLARIMSMLGEMDVVLALADRLSEDVPGIKRSNPKPDMDPNAKPYFYAKDLHNAIIAAKNPKVSVGNDFSIGLSNHPGSAPFHVVAGKTGNGQTTYEETGALAIILSHVGASVDSPDASFSMGRLMTKMKIRENSSTESDAERVVEILRAANEDPHVFTFLEYVFLESEEDADAGIHAALIEDLIHSDVAGMLVTQNPSLVESIRGIEGLNLMGIKERVVSDFDMTTHMRRDPAETAFARLRAGGMSEDFINRARERTAAIRRRHWKFWQKRGA